MAGARYHVLAGLAGFAVDLFYRRVRIDGDVHEVPAEGPVLLVANHPNALIDPVVVSRYANRPVRMLGKAPLFKTPPLSWIMRGVGALPVYRAKDGADTANNDSTFEAVYRALVDGACILIFPEGTSHDEPRLLPMKTGAARMALGALARGATGIVVVPVGLTYRDKQRFRSPVVVDVGAAIDVAAFARGDPDDREAVRALTDAIADGLAAVTIALDSWEDLPLLEAVDAWWRLDDPSRSVRIKRLADGVGELRAHAPAEVAQVRADVVDFVHRLERLGLRPSDVSDEGLLRPTRPVLALRFFVRAAFAVVVELPVALYGALFFAVPFWTVHALALLLKPSRDVAATGKVLVSMLLFPAWLVVVAAALTWWLGPVAAGVACALAPFCGITTRRFFRRRGMLLRDLQVFLRLLLRDRLLRRLRDERDRLTRRFDELAKRLPDAEK